MRTVSDDTEALLTNLVAWELLGRLDFNPKVLLRQVPLTDLSIVSARCGKDGFIVEKLVKLEMLYRTGVLVGDWEIIETPNHRYALQYEVKGTDLRVNDLVPQKKIEAMA